jgi:hypothetical protein
LRIGRFSGERFHHNATIGDYMCPLGSCCIRAGGPHKKDGFRRARCSRPTVQSRGGPLQAAGLEPRRRARSFYRSEPPPY